MKPWKLRVAPLLVLIMVLAAAGVAPGAILKKGSQIINLVNPLVNNGSFLFTGMYIRTTSGNSVPFTGTDQVLVITRISWSFTANDHGLNYPIQFCIGDYLSMGGQFVNGSASNSFSAIPGLPITNFTTKIFVCKLDDPDKVAIEGNLSLRLVGYLAPNQ